MVLSRHKNAGKNHDITIGNRFIENVTQLRYLGATITKQTLIEDEIKKRLNRMGWYALDRSGSG
jgi:hypothetical protein